MAETKQALLIVEDDIEVAEMLNAYFRGQGYEVLAVNWGEDAVKACATFSPNLVILDIRLPDIDGFEVAKRLRANRKTREVPFIFLTDKHSRGERLKGLELGADDYITKPFDVQELRLRVRNAIKRTVQATLTNPITNLPEGVLVDERLQEVLKQPSWSIVQVEIVHLEKFREAYGFVASDDVLRAVALMMNNAVRDLGTPNDFVGQVGPADFIITTQLEAQAAIRERIAERMEQSLDFFYPLSDASLPESQERRLGVQLREVNAGEGPFADVQALKARLKI